jgi:hypothetical protein
VTIAKAPIIIAELRTHFAINRDRSSVDKRRGYRNSLNSVDKVMKFRFIGVGDDGSEKRGTINADSEEHAIRKAKAAGIHVISIEPAGDVERPNEFGNHESEQSTLPPVQVLEPRMQARPAERKIVVSSGAICADYNTLGMVVSFASKADGCGGAISVESVYNTALQLLIQSALARGANGLIFVNFQNRVASQAGCGSSRQVFEVFAWGTAVYF